jgi:hypothetical protein
VVIDKNEIKSTWKFYIAQLFQDERREQPQTEAETSPNIF